MKKIKYTTTIKAMTCLLIIFITCCILKNIEMKQILTNSNHKADAISMKEAITMGYKEAEKWSADAKLVKIISTDKMDDPSNTSGEAGKRAAWNLIFTGSVYENNVNEIKSYNVLIFNRKIVDHVQVDFGNHTRIEKYDSILDSSDALDVAKKNKLLKPGKDWAIGYHYAMEYLPTEDGAERLIIQVFGLSQNGNFAHVDIDEKNGTVVSSVEKIYDEKGNAIWNDF